MRPQRRANRSGSLRAVGAVSEETFRNSFSCVTLGAERELLVTDLRLEGMWTVTVLGRVVVWLSPGTENPSCQEGRRTGLQEQREVGVGIVDRVGNLGYWGGECLRVLGSNMGSWHDLKWEAVGCKVSR